MTSGLLQTYRIRLTGQTDELKGHMLGQWVNTPVYWLKQGQIGEPNLTKPQRSHKQWVKRNVEEYFLASFRVQLFNHPHGKKIIKVWPLAMQIAYI